MAKWDKKVVVIAGGTAGLGLSIAHAFLEKKATVVVLARNQAGIDRVVNDQGSGHLIGIQLDLTDSMRTASVARQIVDAHGHLDVWVNAVGQSTRTRFDNPNEYKSLMEQNFFSAVNGSLAAIPYLKQSHGHLVNVGSLASKITWPFVAPYVTAKHALVGFARQLRLEGPPEIHYLFVCPGPISRGDAGARYASRTTDVPDAALNAGANAPIRGIDSNWLARKIVRACETRKLELVVPWRAKLLFLFAESWPWLGDQLLRRLSNTK